jgi:diguanylate cyclase (GGDEF)-like protein/PAS domain S-box-containing protein
LGRSADFFRQIVMASADAIVAVDGNRKLMFFSPAAEELFGYRSSEILGYELETLMPPRFRAHHPALVDGFLQAAEAARYMGNRTSHVLGLHKDGREIPLGITITKIGDGEQGFVAIVRDLSERIRHEQELNRLANVDPMTGALNRRAFLDDIGREWSRAKRHGTGLSTLLFDIDHFKDVNDRHGHDSGDQVICRFSELVRTHLRDFDLFGRWGGEEFIAAVIGSDPRFLKHIAERIRCAFAELLFEFGNRPPFHVTVSVGGADAKHSASIEDMIKRADAALYRAKNGGRNKVVIDRLQPAAA